MEENIITGVETQKDIEELKKALSVGYAMGTTDQTGFGAVRVESLEQTLKIATEKEKTSKFWLALKKGKAESTVEEFAVVNRLGDAGFYVEGGLPEEYDEDIRREFELVKYVGAVGKVPYVATNVKSIANNIAMVQQLKAIAIIRKLDVKLFFGNADLVPTEFNGFIKQGKSRMKYPEQNIIDLRGYALTPEILAQVAAIIEGNYGDPSNIMGWASINAFQNYAKGLIKNKYYVVGNNEIRDVTSVPKTFAIGNGEGKIETDLHLRFKGETYLDAPHPKLNDAKTAFAPTSSKAPNTLNATTCSATVVADASSLLSAGTYDYCVVPINQYGAGAGFEVTGVVVASGNSVSFTISDNGSTYPATAFEIYRKPSNQTGLTDYRYLKTVSVTETKKDDGSEIPGTEYALFFDWDFDQVLDFKQLLPMVKMPLATIDDSVRWLQKLYGTPILYNPNKMVIVKNVGDIIP